MTNVTPSLKDRSAVAARKNSERKAPAQKPVADILAQLVAQAAAVSANSDLQFLSFSFPKANKLLTAKHYQGVFNRTRNTTETTFRFSTNLLTVIAISRHDQPAASSAVAVHSEDQPTATAQPLISFTGQARLGLIVAKKAFKRANKRNRFKRMVREWFRLALSQLPDYDIIVMAKGLPKQKVTVAGKQKTRDQATPALGLFNDLDNFTKLLVNRARKLEQKGRTNSQS